MERKLYSKEEVERILSRVIKSKGFEGEKFSFEEILNIAKELNLDTSQVILAIKEEENISELEQAKILWQKKKKRDFFQHLGTYAIINSGSIFVNLLLGPPFPLIALMIAFFWGVGLLFDFFESFFPTEDKIERGARKLLRSKKWKEKINSIIDNILESIPSKKGKLF
ncbi:MAG: 2TM domain-containing protein [Ignavibacteria bacterium]|nr:2TM domain-containing protein [Ignavibacteria bacterium]